MVFHALDIMLDYTLVDPEELEEIRQELVPLGNIAGESFTSGGQDQAAILLVIEKAFGIESLHHIGHARLGDTKACRDVDDAGIAFCVDQFEDTFQVILDRGRAPGDIRFSRHADKNERGVTSVKQKEFCD